MLILFSSTGLNILLGLFIKNSILNVIILFAIPLLGLKSKNKDFREASYIFILIIVLIGFISSFLFFSLRLWGK